MSSQVSGDLSKIEGSACKVTYKGTACGHTEGGVTLSAKPKVREVKVDEYGDTIADLVYTGDDFTVRARFTEKSTQVIQTAYQFGGRIHASLWGIGKLPGTRGQSLGGPLLLHPLDGDGVKDDVLLHKAVVRDTADVGFGSYMNDRMWDVTFQALIDETVSGDRLLGQIGVSAATFV